jgi:hypothetical protein
MTEQKAFTARQAAEYLRVSVHTIGAWKRKGIITPDMYNALTGKHGYSRAALDGAHDRRGGSDMWVPVVDGKPKLLGDMLPRTVTAPPRAPTPPAKFESGGNVFDTQEELDEYDRQCEAEHEAQLAWDAAQDLEGLE